MEALFLCVLRMSLAGSVVILGVLLLRLFLRRAPRKYSYFLWLAAVFRLCVPVSLPSPLSLFRLLVKPVSAGEAALEARLSPLLPAGTEALTVGNVAPAAVPALPAAREAAAGVAFPWLRLLAWIWLAGVAALLLYSLISGIRLRLRLRTAIRYSGWVWQASGIASPFLLGLVRPRIYVPWGLEGEDLENALAHENAHLGRGDPWWRLLGWLTLCLHWFDPLCWLAFLLAGRDMELSCDEAVLARRGNAGEYGESLLHIAARGRPFSPAPPAFGELGVRQRLRHALRWKPAGTWVSLAAALTCLLFFCAAVTDAQALAVKPEVLTLNADGTVGALRWGMTPEEALAACPGLKLASAPSEELDRAAVYARMEGVSFLGYTADAALTFRRYFPEDGNRHDPSEGIPALVSLEIVVPGYAELTEELEAALGPRETHQRDLSGRQSVVYRDGKPYPPYEERELPEELWYWHSDETAADLIDAELLRGVLSSRPELTDAEVLEALCFTYGWDARVWVRRYSDGTDTSFVSRGEGCAYRRVLPELNERRPEE